MPSVTTNKYIIINIICLPLIGTYYQVSKRIFTPPYLLKQSNYTCLNNNDKSIKIFHMSMVNLDPHNKQLSFVYL